MNIFTLMGMQFQKWEAQVRDYLSKAFSDNGTRYGSNTIFGQLINVLGSTAQNIMSYIEDAFTEHNKYTASRKRSIYGLAALSGYEPSLGNAAVCEVQLSFLPSNDTSQSAIIPDKTPVTCSQNGLSYNILLPQEAIVMNMSNDNSNRSVMMVEGSFETQSFVSEGGKLYSINVRFQGDCDVQFTEVRVNNELWERSASLYDMDADAKQYVIKTSMVSGFDLVFGNNVHGRALKSDDDVKVTYLLHSGELGNINPNQDVEFTFEEPLVNGIGEPIDGNEVILITLTNKDSVNSGTYSESAEKIKELIGFNSRSLVLADAKNFKQYFSRFSFVGYNRTWVEPGSMIVNSIIMRNYKNLMDNGAAYFDLNLDDFLLNDAQKTSIKNSLRNSNQMLAGTIFNIFSPELCNYAMMMYIKLKDKSYDKTTISAKIENLVGEFFSDIVSDMFIPKSDIVKLVKDNVDEVDGVDVYFISQRNEEAKINNYYIEKNYKYNYLTGTYDTSEEKVWLYENENPMLGLDSHGNIWLESDRQFPILKGKFPYWNEDQNYSVLLEPITIIYE